MSAAKNSNVRGGYKWKWITSSQVSICWEMKNVIMAKACNQRTGNSLYQTLNTDYSADWSAG